MNLPKLDKQNFPILFQTALEEWNQLRHTTETLPSDTAYTLLEMQTMLVDMLNYYMESITDEEEIKFQQLLQQVSLPYLLNEDCEQGCLPEKKIVFQYQTNELIEIPPTHHVRARLEDEWIHLENKQAVILHPNQLTAIFYQSLEGYEDISDRLRFVEGSFQLPVQNHEAMLYLCFDTPFVQNKDISLYFLLDDQKRCPKDHNLRHQAKWELSYKGRNGWEKSNWKDETNGFLYKGIVTFQVMHEMVKEKHFSIEGYWLRFTLLEEQYDMAPIFQSIWLNTGYLYPHKTIAKSYTFANVNDIRIQEDQNEWQIMVLQKTQNQMWERIAYHMESGVDDTHLILDEQTENELQEVRVTLWYEPFMDILDRTCTGISTQRTNITNVYKLRLGFLYDAIHLGEVTCVPQYQETDGGYGCFINSEGLCFGDGRNFLIPPKQEQGLFPFDLVLHERIPNLQANDLIIKEERYLAVNQLMIYPDTNEIKNHAGLYCSEHIESYTRQLPGYALADVNVMPLAQYSGNEFDKGWLVLVSGYERRDIDDAVQKDIEHRLKMTLPIGTKVRVQSIHNRHIGLHVKGLFYFDNPQMQKDLRTILISKIKEHQQLQKDVTILDLQAALYLSTYVLRVSSITLTYDEKCCKVLPFAYDDIYDQIDIVIESQE